MAVKIQLRRDSAANWTSADPTLSVGEPGFETDTGYLKIGDGVTAWAGLAYVTSGGGSMSAAAILAALLTVDGSGSGLDADLLDGNSSAAFATSGHNHSGTYDPAGSAAAAVAQQGEVIAVAVSDETTAITTGTAKVTFRMPFAMTLTSVRASLATASTSGNPAIDINEAGASIFSTTLTIDANEKTSTTATTAAVISDSSLADDAEITVDIDTAGTGAKGLKVYLIGTRT